MAAAKMSVAELEKFLREEFPQAFGGGDITIERADGEAACCGDAMTSACCVRAARCRDRR